MEKTSDKKEYRRAVAVLQKADGKTYDYIAREHKVHIRTTKKWIYDYIKKGIEGLKIRKNHGGPKPRLEKKGCSMKTVDLTCTTGTPPRSRSPSALHFSVGQ